MSHINFPRQTSPSSQGLPQGLESAISDRTLIQVDRFEVPCCVTLDLDHARNRLSPIISKRITLETQHKQSIGSPIVISWLLFGRPTRQLPLRISPLLIFTISRQYRLRSIVVHLVVLFVCEAIKDELLAEFAYKTVSQFVKICFQNFKGLLFEQSINNDTQIGIGGSDSLNCKTA